MDENALHHLLRCHAGIITVTEARRLGVTDSMVSHRVRTRRWTRVAPGTYLVSGHRWSDEARVRAAVAATSGVLHGVSAAWWHGLADHLGSTIHVTIPRERRTTPVAGVRVRRRDLDTRDVTALRDITITSLSLTVLESAIALRDGSVFLDRMLQRRVSFGELVSVQERTGGQVGAPALRTLLSAAADRAGSEAERVLLRLLRRAGVRGMDPGYETLGYEIDVAFPAAMVAVEVDGWAWHHEADRFVHDRARQNALVAAGWTVLRYTWHQLHREPDRVVAEIKAAVRRSTTRDPEVVEHR